MMNNRILKSFSVLVNPRSGWIRLLSLFCIAALAWVLYSHAWPKRFVVWFVFAAVFLFLQMLTWVRWYPSHLPRAGIEDHFDKTRVISVWIVFLTGLIGYLVHPFVLFFALIPLGILSFWNLMMLVFHLQDQDPMAPNFLSGDSRVF